MRLTQSLHKYGMHLSNISYQSASSMLYERGDLYKYFSKFGEVVRAEVKYCDETGMQLNFGFVDFKYKCSLQLCLKEQFHKIHGRTLRIHQNDNRGDSRNTHISVANDDKQPMANKYEKPRNQPMANKDEKPRNQPMANKDEKPINQPIANKDEKPRNQLIANKYEKPTNVMPIHNSDTAGD